MTTSSSGTALGVGRAAGSVDSELLQLGGATDVHGHLVIVSNGRVTTRVALPCAVRGCGVAYLLVERAHGTRVSERRALAGAGVAVHLGDLVVLVVNADTVVGDGLDHGAIPVAAIVDGVVAQAAGLELLGGGGGVEQRCCCADKLLHGEDGRKVAGALGSNLAWVSVFVRGVVVWLGTQGIEFWAYLLF
jgi:hypothetical protein